MRKLRCFAWNSLPYSLSFPKSVTCLRTRKQFLNILLYSDFPPKANEQREKFTKITTMDDTQLFDSKCSKVVINFFNSIKEVYYIV